jgi:DNA-binding NarL/FixJ family response regulator
MSASSILLVEDHAGFAKALLNMLGQNPNLHVVAVAESAEAALKYLRESSVDLVLLDYSLPDMSGTNLLEALLQEHPGMPCAMLSGHLSLQHARRALELGARGYLIKDNPTGILLGIQRVLNGEIYISDELRSLGTTDLLRDLI